MLGCMESLGVIDLCDRINARQQSLRFDYHQEGQDQVLAVAGRQPVRFPEAAGGRLDGGSASWVAKKHAEGAIHEPGLVAALTVLAEVRPDISTILDIGALYGYVSLVARSLFDDVDVHAIEANPLSFKALRRNFEANRATFGDTLHAHHCALSDVSEPQATVRIHRMRVDTLHSPREPGDKGQDHHIDVCSLDDLCRDHQLVPDLIKLDVEGYQAKIVPGGLATIRRCRPVILLEFDSPGPSNDFGVTNREVVEPLLRDGYELIWGKHRYAHVPFRVLRLEDLAAEHEVNSLGILVP